MAEVVQEAPQEFWRSPLVLEPPAVAAPPAAAPAFSEACADCGTEFMIGSRFCHTCGLRRPTANASAEAALMNGLLARSAARVGTGFRSSMRLIAAAWQEISFPDWLHYLHFHEIKRWIGLPTASLIESRRVPGHPDVADRMAAGRNRIVCSWDSAEETFGFR